MQQMTPEERFERIERSMEFLLQQQAPFHSDLRKLEEQTTRNSEQIHQLTEQINQQTIVVGQHSVQIGQLSGALMQVTEELSRRMEAGFSQVNQQLDRLAEAQIHSDERLNIVINIVERYFSNGRQN